jgi:hypothetical protein
MAAPPWFWEGDAVVTETAFTRAGRGRIPRFGVVFRTNLLEGRTFNYNKQHLRSFKHFIPDHYVLGYHMVGHLRKRTGDGDVWGKITGRSWDAPFVPFAFSNAIKNKSGLYVTDLYRDMAATLKKEWQDDIDKLQLTTFEKINTRTTKAYTDYLYPQPQEDGSVLVMKSGIGDIDQFVLLKDGKEKKVYTPGFVNDAGMLSAHSNVVVWNEYGYHPRWRIKNYSRVKLYDFATKKERIIGEKNDRFGAASLSPGGDKIVTIRSDKEYKSSIVIFEFFTGRVIQEFRTERADFYSMPRWSPDGSKVVLLRTTAQGKTISIFDVNANTLEDLLPVSDENVGHPVLTGDHVLFNSPVSGIDNIYAVELATKKRKQVTVSKYGAYNPALTKDGKIIYFNEQSRDGMNVARIPHDPSSWRPFEKMAAAKPLSQYVAEQEGHQHMLDSVPQHVYPVKRYSKLKGLINPYSWGLNLTNDLNNVQFGISSKDLLSTTSINAGYVYDINERTGFWRAGVSYQGLFPVLDVTIEGGDRESNKRAFGNEIKTSWREITVEGGVRVPLLLTNSRYIQQLTIGNAVGITMSRAFLNSIYEDGMLIYRGKRRIAKANDSLEYIYKDELNEGDLIYNRASVSYARLLKTSYRDFLYRWGQTLSIDFLSTPFNGDFRAQLLAIRSALYFPGIGKHHYLYFRGAYQESLQGFETDLYTFRNRISKPRGYSYPTDEKFMTLSANYSLPLWYPDIALGPILNIQRIKSNLFFDYGSGMGKQYYYNTDNGNIYFTLTDADYQSVGIETTVDFNLFRFAPKFELGVRATYISENPYHNAGPVFEFLIGNIGF